MIGTKTAAGYTIMCSKAVSCTQGGVALVWKENNLRFEVKLVLFHGPKYSHVPAHNRG
jgi:hypothetical protein